MKTKCPKCKGTGAVPLTAKLDAVYRALPVYTSLVSAKGSTTAGEIAERLDIKPTAANNRLEKLRKLGLVERAELTTGWGYYRKPQPETTDEANPSPKRRTPKKKQ